MMLVSESSVGLCRKNIGEYQYRIARTLNISQPVVSGILKRGKDSCCCHLTPLNLYRIHAIVS